MERTGHEEQTTPTHILVVDDEPDMELLVRQKMRRQMRKGEYKLDFALNGIEALEKLTEESGQDIEMVVTDINMPKMNGLELLAEIAKRKPHIRSIVVSAYGDMDNIRTAMNLGAFDFVTKPVDFDDLRATIGRTEEHIRTWHEAMRSRDQLATRRKETDMARSLQQSVLPNEMPTSHRYDIHASLTPAREIGGDFFDIVKLESEQLGLAVGDVSGKGISAALFMMSARSVLKGTAIGASDPVTALSEMNQIIAQDNQYTMFLTLVYMVYNPRTGEMRYANGGHPRPFLVRRDGSCTELGPVKGIVIGVNAESEFEEGEAVLEPGEMVIMYSDGVVHAENAAGEQFGMERLHRLFVGQAPIDAREATGRIREAVGEFALDAAERDDITCLALRRKET